MRASAAFAGAVADAHRGRGSGMQGSPMDVCACVCGVMVDQTGCWRLRVPIPRRVRWGVRGC